MDTTQTQITLNAKAIDYQKKMCNPMVFWFAMLAKLPSAVFGDYESRLSQLKNAKSLSLIFGVPKILLSPFILLRWQELPNSAPGHFVSWL